MPIRPRVTLVFAGVMAVLLAGLGLFVFERFRSDLDDSIDEGLRSRAEQVTRQVEQLPPSGTPVRGVVLVQREESFAQAMTSDGRVLETGPQLGTRPLLDASQRARASENPAFFEDDGNPVAAGSVRIFATPVETPAGRVVVAAGASLDDRKDSLHSLKGVLLIGGPAALLLASLAGYLAAGLALRPVEGMRRRAAEISAAEPGERLPVSSADDELSRLGTTLNEMLARLEQAFERERTFVDDASHELRTPLAMQKTELETALRYGHGPDELRAAIASAVEEVDRLIRLAEDLLVLARSQNGELALEAKPLEIAPLLEGVGERFAQRAAASGRSLRVEAPTGLEVRGDRTRLEQALTNMLDNALRYGGGEVRLWARAEGDDVELHVSDEGEGFPPRFLDRAFERFSRADPARGPGGSGLGLAIVEAVARSHGGGAHAKNRPEGGADVSISIHGRFIAAS
ncbi:MAG: sensor histidine kinase [Solirubrobacterales bacterium]